MPIVILNTGSVVLLPVTLGKATFGSANWKLHLFINNFTPDETTVLDDFTEATFSGSAAQDIDRSLWTSPTIISNRASMTANSGNPFTFTNGSSAQTVYGYYVTDQLNTVALWCEKFGTARTLNTGDELDVTIPFTGGTQT